MAGSMSSPSSQPSDPKRGRAVRSPAYVEGCNRALLQFPTPIVSTGLIKDMRSGKLSLIAKRILDEDGKLIDERVSKFAAPVTSSSP